MRQAKEQISLRVRAVQSTIIKPGLSRASTQPHSQNTFTGARAKGSASVEAPIPILSVFEKKCNFFFYLSWDKACITRLHMRNAK